MTIYGTPGGTPLNTSPFQGTAPGNPPQIKLSAANPGVGLFPPGSDNSSGDSTLASLSRAAMPANAQIGAGNIIPPNSAVLTRISDFGANGYGGGNPNSVFVGNIAAAGGAGPGAGGMNQTPSPSGGSDYAIPAQAAASIIVGVFANPGPQYNG